MRKIKLLFALILTQFLSFSQDKNWFHYDWKNAEGLKTEVFSDSKEFFKNFYKDNIYVGALDEKLAISESSSFYTDYMLGNIYPKFNDYESYIKTVLKQVVKDTVMINKLKIYFYYESDLNASMDALGNLRVYVGLFNYINSEAELAAVLAHEYAHFFNKDGLEKTRNETYFFYVPYYDYGHHLKSQEIAADFLAINFLKESKYSTKGIANVFKSFKRFEIKNELLYGNNKVHSYTHPDPGDRLKQVKILAKDSVNVGKKLFVVDSVKFMNLKKMASQEAFNIMLERRYFNDLIELSFVKYLYQPNDEENLAILIDGIRRFLSLNPKESDKQFIIEQYKGKGSKRSDNYSYVDEDKTSILKYLNKGLLHLPILDLSKIVAKELLDSTNLKFTTYKEALTYFSNKSTEIICKPCAISSMFKSEKEFIYNEQAFADNTVFNCTDYLKNNQQTKVLDKNIYILRLPSINNLKYFDIDIEDSYTNFLKLYIKKFKEATGLDNLYLMIDLPFNEQHQFSSLNAIAESIVKRDIYNKVFYNIETNPYQYPMQNTLQENYTKKETLKWENYSPELFSVFLNHGVKNVYIVDFETIKLNQNLKANRIGWKYKKVSLSLKSDNVVYEHKISTNKSSYLENLELGAKNFKYFISFNK